jgi:hypothetical protein
MLEQRGVLVRVGAYSMDIWPLDRHGTSTRSHGGAGATAEMARLKKAVRGRGPRRAVTAWERRRCSINNSGFADDDGSGQRESRRWASEVAVGAKAWHRRVCANGRMGLRLWHMGRTGLRCSGEFGGVCSGRSAVDPRKMSD